MEAFIGQKLKILVVDDDDVDRMAVVRVLMKTAPQAEVVEAQGAAGAVTALTGQVFDCALLDYMLPDGDGLSVLMKVRDANVSTPIIMLTGQGDERLAVELLHAGASDYLLKSMLSAETLAHSVQVAMRLSRAESERQQALEALRSSEVRTRTILETAPDGIITINESGMIEAINQAGAEIFGYRVEELSGKKINVLMPLPHAEKHDEYMSRYLQSGEKRIIGFGVHEVEGVHKDGRTIPLDLTVSEMAMAGQRFFVGMMRDVSERKRAERALRKEKIALANTIDQLRQINAQLEDTQNQLLQSEKMASIGQLAAGVAHEINNPVGFINSNLGSLKNHVEDLIDIIQFYEVVEQDMNMSSDIMNAIQKIKQEKDLEYVKEDVRELVEESREGVERVKNIVQDLKDFSHVDEVEWQWADLHKGIDSTLNIVNNEIKYKAKVVKEYGDLPEVECIISQLNQVFMNLLVNAAHAIEEHGTITIRTGTKDEGVWVEIEDTGMGMDDETQRKIFDPFFTTKPVGKGTGLGLSLSYGIIQKHNGTISVDSEIGQGTKFHIWLPVQQEEQQEKLQAAHE